MNFKKRFLKKHYPNLIGFLKKNIINLKGFLKKIILLI